MPARYNRTKRRHHKKKLHKKKKSRVHKTNRRKHVSSRHRRRTRKRNKNRRGGEEEQKEQKVPEIIRKATSEAAEAYKQVKKLNKQMKKREELKQVLTADSVEQFQKEASAFAKMFNNQQKNNPSNEEDLFNAVDMWKSVDNGKNQKDVKRQGKFKTFTKHANAVMKKAAFVATNGKSTITLENVNIVLQNHIKKWKLITQIEPITGVEQQKVQWIGTKNNYDNAVIQRAVNTINLDQGIKYEYFFDPKVRTQNILNVFMARDRAISHVSIHGKYKGTKHPVVDEIDYWMFEELKNQYNGHTV